MKRRTALIAFAMVIALLAHHTPARALSCDTRALIYCYDRCAQVFPNEILRSSCNAGCLIACFAHGTS
jgi:hypothetical protein